jgi:hypothetical protein
VARRIEFPLESGGSIVVEGLGTPAVGPAGRAGIERAAATLRQSLSPVVDAASDVLDAFRALPRKPDDVEVRFGVALDAKFGAILATGSAGVHLEVTLRWSPDSGGGNNPDESAG